MRFLRALFALLLLIFCHEVSAGDYLFVYARVPVCGINSQAVDYARLSSSGLAKFSSGVELELAGQAHNQVSRLFAAAVAEKFEIAIRVVSVVAIDGHDTRKVADHLRMISGSRPPLKGCPFEYFIELDRPRPYDIDPPSFDQRKADIGVRPR